MSTAIVNPPTEREPERLERAARDVDARSTAAFDANDPAAPSPD